MTTTIPQFARRVFPPTKVSVITDGVDGQNAKIEKERQWWQLLDPVRQATPYHRLTYQGACFALHGHTKEWMA